MTARIFSLASFLHHTQMEVKPSDDTLREALSSIYSAGCALHQVNCAWYVSSNTVLSLRKGNGYDIVHVRLLVL